MDYSITDFAKNQNALNDDTINGMVICDSSEQAKNVCSLNAQYAKTPTKTDKEFSIAHATELEIVYLSTNKKQEKADIKSAALILRDVGTKQERKEWMENFKVGNIDLLFVYNMLVNMIT